MAAVAVASEKIEADYRNFIKAIEEASRVEIEKIKQELGALKAKAAEIGEAVELSS